MSDPSAEPIICRTTPWYTRRKLLMLAMLLAFAGWFYKDYRWGYPKAAAVYAEYKKVIDLPDGQEQWKKLSVENHWDIVPDEITPDKIRDQGIIAAGLGLGALAVLVSFLLNRGRTLTADSTSFTPPRAKAPIPFDAVTRVDKTPWKHKGLARVYYKDASGAERKTVIDDLMFGGADRILDRLLTSFRGEIIDVAEEPPPPTAEGDKGPADPVA